ncbi:hypothetical protein HIM_02806 [Hirsutella minnesotensis 3608]|nr:hypothetical protein HIM_02806 [Hirsutella minnesotensis 3608]
MTTVTSSAAAALSATPRPITVNFLPHGLSGIEGFFPFHDLEHIHYDGEESFFRKFIIVPGAKGDRHMSLFPSGCQIPGEKARDCPRACHDKATLFGSLETFYNCMALASIAYWSRQPGAYHLSEEAEHNASALMAGSSVAAFDEDPVLASIVTCALEACGGDGIRQPCDDSVKALTTLSPPPEVFEAMSLFCPKLPVEINPDIFGPGVLISYALQVCFASMLFLFLKGFTLWVSYSQKNKEAERRRRAPFLDLQRRLTRIESMIWRDSSALSRTSIAIATTLVEFQEAQCWFVFAIQIASILAIVVNSQEGSFWGEIILNSAVAFHVSQNGILPMFLIQLSLHNEGIRNWHTFLGFFAEYVLATVATSQKVSFADAFKLFRKEKALPACGENPSPRSYCATMQGVEGLNLSFFPRPFLYKIVFLALDTLAIIILVVDQLSWTLRTHRLTRDMRIGGYRLGRGPTGRLKPGWMKLKKMVWLTLELAYLLVNILYLVSLIKVFSSDSFEANRWSYGQIIAMTVWGPVIVKLFNLVLSGPPKNGTSLNSGPPRLRIDNVINHRLGPSADEDVEDDDFDQQMTKRLPTSEEGNRSRAMLRM